MIQVKTKTKIEVYLVGSGKKTLIGHFAVYTRLSPQEILDKFAKLATAPSPDKHWSRRFGISWAITKNVGSFISRPMRDGDILVIKQGHRKIGEYTLVNGKFVELT